MVKVGHRPLGLRRTLVVKNLRRRSTRVIRLSHRVKYTDLEPERGIQGLRRYKRTKISFKKKKDQVSDVPKRKTFGCTKEKHRTERTNKDDLGPARGKDPVFGVPTLGEG